MDSEKVAKELVAVVRDLAGAGPAESKKIDAVHPRVQEGYRGDLHATFDRRDPPGRADHTFTGVSFGYGGEGPRGLIELAKMFGYRLNADKVMSHDDKPGTGGTFDPLRYFRG